MARVKCKNCLEETVYIETQATHISDDYVEHGLNGYDATNNDSSWRAESGSERFMCDSCGAYWPVDGEINWIWTDDR
jgi:hypothetical protein